MIMILPWWVNSDNSIKQTSKKILSWSLERKITWQKDQSNLFHHPKKRTQNSFFRGCWKYILCHEQSCGQIWRSPLMICLLEWPCQNSPHSDIVTIPSDGFDILTYTIQAVGIFIPIFLKLSFLNIPQGRNFFTIYSQSDLRSWLMMIKYSWKDSSYLDLLN